MKSQNYLRLVRTERAQAEASWPAAVTRLDSRRPANASPFAVLYASGGALMAYDPTTLDT